jgi:enterobactin synthetase component D
LPFDILITPPPLFPAFVAHLGAAISAESFPGTDIEIPAALAAAVSSRRAEFVAGRLCARAALLALGAASTTVPRGSDRAPEWPDGFVGSISHSAGFAFAAAARASEARTLGLDVEQVSRFETARITRIVTTPSERTRFDISTETLAIIFSAKEAVYKCLYPLLRQFLEFDAIELDEIGPGSFSCHPTRKLSGEFTPETLIEGRYAVTDGLIHTGVMLSPA